MGWNFYNASGELQINDGGVQAASAVFTGNVDLGSNLLVGNAGSTGIAISSAGEVTMAAQPAFLVEPTSEQSNLSGDGTTATIVWGTEIFDQNADFASNAFTAPVTGRYLLIVAINVGDVTSAANDYIIKFVTSNSNYTFAPGDVAPGSQPNINVAFSMLVDMDAADTVTVTYRGIGESGDVHDLIQGRDNSAFSGVLIA